MRYILFILFTFFLLPSSIGYADLQGDDPLIDYREPDFGILSEWWKNIDVAPIYYELSSFVPEGYFITDVESSCWYDSECPQLWITGMSYHHPIFGNTKPSILQVWRPHSNEQSAKLIQEFQWEQSLIQDINWVRVGDELFLYVVAETVMNSTLLCFQIIKGESKLRLVSEEYFHHVLWPIYDLQPWGSVFATVTYKHAGENPTGYLGNETFEFITLTDRGFFRTHYIELKDLMTKEELESIRSSRELQGASTFKLLATSEWRAHLQEGTIWLGDPSKQTSIDGYTYYSSTGDWKEVTVG